MSFVEQNSNTKNKLQYILRLSKNILYLKQKFFKAIAIGVAVGMAAHLAVDTLFSLADVSFIPGTFLLDKAWLLLNAAVCFVMAVLTGKSS